MPQPPSDRPLRRLVAELAEMPPEDVAAVLANISRPRQSKIQALIAEYGGHDAEIVAPVRARRSGPARRRERFDQYSPWLATRLDAALARASKATSVDRLSRSAATLQSYAMTETAMTAALACARRLDLVAPSEPTDQGARAITWFAGLGGALGRYSRRAS